MLESQGEKSMVSNCPHHENHTADYCPSCLIGAVERADKMHRALLRLRAQFAGYALRVAPNDAYNDVILGTIEEAINEGKASK